MKLEREIKGKYFIILLFVIHKLYYYWVIKIESDINQYKIVDSS
jgi:hypothetical protein